MKKSILSIVLALVLCLSMLPAAYASEELAVEPAEEVSAQEEAAEEPVEQDGMVEMEADALDAADELAISAENFPDEAFRNYVSETFDKDKSGTLSQEELSAKEMDCRDLGIQYMTGLSHFTELMFLWCSGNNLTELDVSKLTELVTLDCSENKLTSLDVSQNVLLERLYTHGNKLTRLDVQGIVGLVTYAQGTPYNYGSYDGYGYETTNLGFNAILTCDRNVTLVTGVDQGLAINGENFPDEAFRTYVSETFDSDNSGTLSRGELSVQEMDCRNLGIKNMTGLSYFTELMVLQCSGNALEELDVSKLTGLVMLDCSNNALTSLGVSENTDLEGLYAHGNSLTSLDIQGIRGLLMFAQGTPHAYDGYVGYGYETSSGFNAILTCDTDVALVTGTDDELAISAENFPDEAFRNYVSETFDKDNSGTLSQEELAAREMDCQNLGIQNMTGLSNFTELMFLWCAGNDLTELDVSALTKLVTLDCSENALTSLVVSQNLLLERLYVHSNALRYLDVRANNGLEPYTKDEPYAYDGYVGYGYETSSGFNAILTCDTGVQLVTDAFLDIANTDGTGEVNALDLVQLMKYVVGVEGITLAEGTGDLNSDTKIDIQDVVSLLIWLAA